MPTPFSAATWQKVSDSPCPLLAGANFSLVAGIGTSGYHARSRTLQIASRFATSFVKSFNTAFISFDGGHSWTMTYDGRFISQGGTQITQEEEQSYVTRVFTVDAPRLGPIHYQVRVNFKFDFLIANGTLYAGDISLWAAGPGPSSTFQRLQTLHSWPHIPAPNGGGQAFFTTAPSITPPVLIPGSGPGGRDAFWMMTNFILEHGAAGNRQQIVADALWRSTNGVDWENVGAAAGGSSYGTLFQSPSGRVFASMGGAIRYTDDAPDMIGATWQDSIINGTAHFGSNVDPMYGGTLVSSSHGGIISGGFVVLSCDDGTNFFAGEGLIPVNSSGIVLKLGPAECILITPGFDDPSTETKCWYSADGGETWADGGVWLASGVGEAPVGGFMRADGHPLIVTQNAIYFSSDKARGVAGTRTICPLANAGLAAARPLVICGHPLTNNLCEDH